ncbi:hypothetical protein HK100_006306 [Physocladia obscura]|uniref:Uncharacterized protein n=1 Tax=Physocladia obscura TaxID=109957 RepID=A0AAD5T7T5_9FUNG|nr:hypothetical protein HK100_006306 [Physocladia obscura]
MPVSEFELYQIQDYIRTTFLTHQEQLPDITEEIFEFTMARFMYTLSTHKSERYKTPQNKINIFFGEKDIRKILWKSIEGKDPTYAAARIVDLCFPSCRGILMPGYNPYYVPISKNAGCFAHNMNENNAFIRKLPELIGTLRIKNEASSRNDETSLAAETTIKPEKASAYTFVEDMLLTSTEVTNSNSNSSRSSTPESWASVSSEPLVSQIEKDDATSKIILQIHLPLSEAGKCKWKLYLPNEILSPEYIREIIRRSLQALKKLRYLRDEDSENYQSAPEHINERNRLFNHGLENFKLEMAKLGFAGIAAKISDNMLNLDFFPIEVRLRVLKISSQQSLILIY